MKILSLAKREPWGWSQAIDCRNCPHELISDKEHISKFAYELVDKIKMKMKGEPIIENFGEGIRKGYTLVVLIETSDITAHFCENNNDAYIDVFSCAPFEEKDVIEVVNKYFKPEKTHSNKLERGAN